ncbi:hypothetical protein BCR33DRAFT_724615 [Rhizoclosmatium globosum]|uniref:Methyltransferase domain-containing protein n=1 Tax=Rhizoclosmatium globosum TaxID=329046 RepID=A0A1Y2B4H9_9FUNG|nr:hypothetical protein BCR33DRAFT_724615 [Rhizoclosmatium globosum]|eukprot:ORY29731.1 hypothetical protein BCR33DRAFT_724615 [Rhizoclosmatium globosum]
MLFEDLLHHFPNDDDIAPVDDNFPRWTESDGTYAPFIPTSLARVKLALELAGCCSGDKVLDLGCGDGRFCVAAVTLFGAQGGIGIESDETVVVLAEEKRNAVLGPNSSSTVIYTCEDFRESKLAQDNSISIVVVFLSPEFGLECKGLLLKHYNRGARIIALVFDLSDIKELIVKEGCNNVDGIWVYQKPTTTKE